MDNLTQLINKIKENDASLFHKDFLLTWDKSDDELKLVLDTADLLQAFYRKNLSARCFNSGLAVSQFRDNSNLDEGKSQIAHGETVRETSNMISFLTEIIGIRDDMFLGAGHTYMMEVGKALDDGFKEGVLPQRPGIINLQCDVDHPTQSMADLLHLKHWFGSLEHLRGKKIAMSWAYSPSYGKPLSVPQGIIGLMTRLGMEVVLAYPEGYGLIREVVERAGIQSDHSMGSFTIVNSMEEAFHEADIVYPKSWAPYHNMERRTTLLNNNDQAGLKELEKECLANNARFKNWECTEGMIQMTKDGNALYMHCLPADISGVSCQQGEVSASVFDKYRIATYKEAGFKPYIIASMMLTNRFEDPAGVLEKAALTARKL
ncbi:MAG: knotted carbamoyltransferase YgeW [Bacteroidetes bacterium]|nr:knotted carbamoyltransferase YgeW [Bacteroidota bacterium]